MRDEILRRIERELGVPDLAERLSTRIQQADLHSLLLEVFRRRASERTAAAVLADYGSNRFVHPSAMDPRALVRFDAAAFAALPPGFEPIELSPVAPLGTSSVLATVHQDKVLTSIRSVEVLSDATNVLALECAARRRKTPESVHLAASHRHLRTSLFEGPLSFAHFRLFALCSAGRDSRDARFHPSAVDLHLRFYTELLRDFMGPDFAVRIALTDLASEAPRDEWLKSYAHAELVSDPARARGTSARGPMSGRGYYTDVCFKIHARVAGGEWLEIGDGGAFDWTRKLLSNAKERLVISAISSERVCALISPAA